MSKMVKIFIGIIIGTVLIGAPLIGSYNSLANAESEVDYAWAEIDNKLQRRNDLIPNLVSSVKGVMAHEEEVFTAIADARAEIGKADNVADTIEANSQMTTAVTNLIAVSENYPEIKSNDNMTRLMDELAGTENRISVERGRYNEAVQKYNLKLKKLPTSMFAGALGYESKPFFEADEEAKISPVVDFE